MTGHITILSTKVLKSNVTKQALLAGFDVVEYDFIRISYTGYLDNLRPTLVFTSRHAVKAFDAQRTMISSVSGKFRAYCLQGETLKALSAISDIEVVSVAKDALTLADNIIADNYTNELSFICGHQRRDDLPDLLRQNGINVHEVKVYETHYSGTPVKHTYGAVLFFSPSAAESFFQTNILPAGLPCFCIGKTTAVAVQCHTNNPVIEAKEPSQESVLEAVTSFFKKKK